MIVPLGKSEKLYRYAVTCWIVGSDGTRTRYEFGSTIDQEARVSCFLYVRFRYRIFQRFFRREREKSRFIASVTGDQSEFLHHFNTVRAAIWREYGEQIPFQFCAPEELRTIQFDRGFLGKLKVHLIKAWRAVRGEK